MKATSASGGGPHGERELIERAKRYEPEVLREIYERFSPGIYRYIYFRTNDRELAEDLRAEVFLRMLDGLDRFDYRGWSISAWLYRIAHDRVIDHFRGQERHQMMPLEESLVDSAPDPGETLLSTLAHEELREALQQLTEEQQQVILLRFVEDLSVREVAQITRRTEGAIKALQYRGLRSLLRILSPGEVV
ncbi:MAG: sigma-70 family RNA polymerase sigma factor [Ardenticatenaceae bacterium]|nr:sigma-70 family RNA polymerase sigma factor [Ardenticatenaceae bacterium]